jgi:hypothetical protein
LTFSSFELINVWSTLFPKRSNIIIFIRIIFVETYTLPLLRDTSSSSQLGCVQFVCCFVSWALRLMENKKTVRLHYKSNFVPSVFCLVNIRKKSNTIIKKNTRQRSVLGCFMCFILESNRPSSPSWHSSSVSSSRSGLWSNDCRNISRYPLVAGATAFNFL